MRDRILVFLLVLAMLAACCSCQKKEAETSSAAEETSSEDPGEVVEASRDVYAMDTYMSLTCYGVQAEEAIQAAVDEIERLDDLLSTGNEESEISKLNAAGSAALSEDAEAMIEEALEIYERSDGALDISIYPVVQLWGFPTQTLHVPTAAELEETLAKVDAGQLQLENGTLTLGEGQEIDLGAIAKGYTSSRIMEIFADYGIEAGVISLGGNVQVYKTKLDGSKWRIGITNPLDPEGTDYTGVLELEDQAAITSGGYERYLTDEETGETYHHILDPATGYPADSGIISSTIVSADGTLADGLSTATFIMGLERSIDYWRTYGDDFGMVLVDSEGKIYVTSDLEDCFSSDQEYEVIER